MIKLAKDLIIRSSTEEFITFKLQEKDKGIQVRYENETLWMTQKAMAELFDVEQPAIAKHLINIYNERELDKNSTYSKMELVQKEGTRNVKRNVEFYNLDAIISVGYRVNSLRATQFRMWATNVLKTFTIQGYVLDKERMKNGSFIDKDYFEKLLEEIREIRLSERRFYQKVTDIYATSIDYDSKSPISIEFFKKVQNKMHYALSRKTAAEMLSCGGLLTEYSSQHPTHKGNFVARNRIVAGMSDATLIIESAEKGGSLITAGIAESYHRDVFALPGNIQNEYSKGCNQLIRNNRKALVTSARCHVLGHSG